MSLFFENTCISMQEMISNHMHILGNTTRTLFMSNASNGQSHNLILYSLIAWIRLEVDNIKPDLL